MQGAAERTSLEIRAALNPALRLAGFGRGNREKAVAPLLMTRSLEVQIFPSF